MGSAAGSLFPFERKYKFLYLVLMSNASGLGVRPMKRF